MSPEERERTMQFLLQSQAQHEANFARLETSLAGLDTKTNQIADGLLSLTKIVDAGERKVKELADSVVIMRDGILGLTGIVGRREEEGERLDQRLKDLAEAGQQTDRRLKQLAEAQDRLGDYFERHLRDDHGRRPS